MPKNITSNSVSGQIMTALLKNTIKSMGSGVLLGALGYFIYKKMTNQRQQQTCYQAFRRLKQKGYIASKQKGKATYYYLTPEGKKIATILLTHINLPAPQPKSWDGKWRFLCFDIPEDRRRDRALLRQLIYRYHFRKYQASVWVTPYDNLELIKNIIIQARLGQYVQTLIAEQIDKVEYYKKLFKLR